MATSKYTGVRAERGIWRADIQVDKKKKFLGYHKSEIAAAQAYNDAVLRLGLKRKLNKIAVIQPPTSGTMQLMSGRSVLFQALGITSVSVEVCHNKLITLTDAVKLGINDRIKMNLPFSAHDITEWIRDSSEMGEFALTDVPFHHEKGKWIQKVDHEKVRAIVHELHDSYHFSATKRDNGVYISYIP